MLWLTVLASSSSSSSSAVTGSFVGDPCATDGRPGSSGSTAPSRAEEFSWSALVGLSKDVITDGLACSFVLHHCIFVRGESWAIDLRLDVPCIAPPCRNQRTGRARSRQRAVHLADGVDESSSASHSGSRATLFRSFVSHAACTAHRLLQVDGGGSQQRGILFLVLILLSARHSASIAPCLSCPGLPPPIRSQP